MKPSPISIWIDAARTKLAAKTLTAADLDQLAALATPASKLRQRLLYLSAQSPSVLSGIIAMDLREPTRYPNGPTLSPKPHFPYNNVHDAIVDGWRVIHFPLQAIPFDDRLLTTVGYEFILEKLEPYSD